MLCTGSGGGSTESKRTDRMGFASREKQVRLPGLMVVHRSPLATAITASLSSQVSEEVTLDLEQIGEVPTFSIQSSVSKAETVEKDIPSDWMTAPRCRSAVEAASHGGNRLRACLPYLAISQQIQTSPRCCQGRNWQYC